LAPSKDRENHTKGQKTFFPKVGNNTYLTKRKIANSALTKRKIANSASFLYNQIKFSGKQAANFLCFFKVKYFFTLYDKRKQAT